MINQTISVTNVVLLLSAYLTEGMVAVPSPSGKTYDVTDIKYDVSGLSNKIKVNSIIHCAVYHALHSDGESLEGVFVYYPEDDLCWTLQAELESGEAVDVTLVKKVRLGKRKQTTVPMPQVAIEDPKQEQMPLLMYDTQQDEDTEQGASTGDEDALMTLGGNSVDS